MTIREEKKLSDDDKLQHHHIEPSSHAHHSGILRSVLERAVANRFSSKPIDMEKHRLEAERLSILAAEEDARVNNSIREVGSGGSLALSSIIIEECDPAVSGAHQQHYPTLTASEQAYLETLLESEDPEAIQQATLVLSDRSLFPREDLTTSFVGQVLEDETTLSRRDSQVQRLFFRMHEVGRRGGASASSSPAAKAFTSSPIPGNGSRRRLGWNERKEGLTVLELQTSMSSLLDVRLRNSILGDCRTNSMVEHEQEQELELDDFTDFDDILAEDGDNYPQVPADRSGSSSTSQDISSWLDGVANTDNQGRQQQGIEVDNSIGVMTTAKLAAESFFKTSFAILGTAADDASCHPHVLSPPLMESLLEFVPESLSDYHFWIKYSMVRDGANLYTLLRHVRASSTTILAIETTDGHVFGAFTPQPWRLVQSLTTSELEGENEPTICDDSFYGSKDTFLWKMRQSRFESQALVRSATVEQAILMESELAVYPYTGNNQFIQHCSVEDGIGFGDNATAIRLDPSLRTGSTAASDTFGNPCLLAPKERSSMKFHVANVEVWALTPKDSVNDAEQLELTKFFQQRRQEEPNKRLDLFKMLVCRPKRK